MKKQELYNSIKEFSALYSIPFKITKKTSKKQLQHIYDHLLNGNESGPDTEIDTEIDTDIDEPDTDLWDTQNFLENDEQTDDETIDNVTVVEKERDIGVTGKDIESMIKKQLKKYASSLGLYLKVYQLKHRQNKLTETDIEKIIHHYNEMKQNILKDIEESINKLDKELDLKSTFYDYIDLQINTQEKRIERLIS